MRPTTFRTQLLALVLLALILLLALGLSGWWGIHRVSQNLDRLYAHSVAPAEGLIRALDAMHRIRAQALFAATETTEAAASSALAALAPLDQAIDTHWQAVRSHFNDPDLRTAADRFEAEWAAYRQARDQSVLMIEVGDLSSALHNMKFNAGAKFQLADDTLQTIIRRQAELARRYQEAAGRAQRWAERVEIAVSLIGLAAFILAAIGLFRATARKLGGAPEQVSVLVNEVAKGNLQLTIPLRPNDRSSLLHAVQGLVGELTEVLRTIDLSARQMQQTSHKIASISHEIATVSQREQERSSAVTEVTTTVSQAADEVQRLAVSAVDRATGTEQSARQGLTLAETSIQEMALTVEQVQQAARRIAQLDRSVQQIQGILDSIRTIAGQTNLLALNAAIESARAGEAGRGFAVVAGEVRQLAGRTTEATREIGAIVQTWLPLVQEIAQDMSQVVNTVERSQTGVRGTTEVIRGMAESVAGLAHSNREIAQASEGQTNQVHSLQERLGTLFETLRENTTKVGLTALISDDLARTTSRLNQLMQRFTFDRRHEDILSSDAEDRRRSPRVEGSIRVLVQQGNQPLIEGISQDISRHGLRLKSLAHLDPAQPIRCEIYTPYPTFEEYQRQTPLAIPARIVWQETAARGEQHYGVEFGEMTARQAERLATCLTHGLAGARV